MLRKIIIKEDHIKQILEKMVDDSNHNFSGSVSFIDRINAMVKIDKWGILKE